jgi:CubicO group peptidase (beta-lactamase class C family)
LRRHFSLTVVTLHLATGLTWPAVLNYPQFGFATPGFTWDRADATADAPGLEHRLSRDPASALAPGSPTLGRGTGAGLAIGVTWHGVRRIYGTAKPESIFEIGSITKTFTGLILARMAAAGKVRLEEPVRELLPEDTAAKPRGPKITLLDLTTQHSGLPPLPPTSIPPAGTTRLPTITRPTCTLTSTGMVPPIPHAGFLCSNVGVGLLGQALANRAGMSWSDLAREQVTGPLGLPDTAVSLSAEPAGPSHFKATMASTTRLRPGTSTHWPAPARFGRLCKTCSPTWRRTCVPRETRARSFRCLRAVSPTAGQRLRPHPDCFRLVL